MTDAEILYKNVKLACIDRNTTIGKVEKQVGLSRGYLERAKNQRSEVRVSTIRKFAEALDVSMLILMRGMY